MGVTKGLCFAALLTLPWALWFFPLDADGAFSLHDSIIYGVIVETEPQWSLNPHHPGFHALQNALMPVLDVCGVTHPGFVAARILAGLGAAFALVLIARFAKGRLLFGVCCAAAFATTRICAMETAVGEVNLPSIAAALWALREATAERVRPWRFGSSIVVALALRQDSILLLPALLTAAWMGLGPGRFGLLLRVLCCAGLATLAVYAACFQFVRYEFDGRQIHFHEWLVLYAHVPQMAATHAYGLERLAIYARSLGSATFGQYSEAVWPHALAGSAWCVIVLLAGCLARADAARKRLGVAVLFALAMRIPFFTWFEPENCEWHALNLALVTALAASLGAGRAQAPARARLGALLLLALCAFAVATHGSGLLDLRRRNLMQSVETVVAVAGPDAAYFTLSNDRAAHALRFLHIYPRIHATDSAVLVDAFELVQKGRTVAFVTDRLVGDGLPWTNWATAKGGALLEVMREHSPEDWTRYFNGPAGPYAVIVRKP